MKEYCVPSQYCAPSQPGQSCYGIEGGAWAPWTAAFSKTV